MKDLLFLRTIALCVVKIIPSVTESMGAGTMLGSNAGSSTHQLCGLSQWD